MCPTRCSSIRTNPLMSGHGKKGDTPESHGGRGDAASPTGSQTSELGGGTHPPVHPLDEVLTGDEIEALRITEEKLKQVCPITNHTQDSLAADKQLNRLCRVYSLFILPQTNLLCRVYSLL